MADLPSSLTAMPAFSRRHFLRSASGAVLLASAATRLAAAAPANDRRRIRVGFLGISYSHFAAKYKLLSQSPDWDVIGLCEEDAAVRAQGPGDARRLEAKQLFAEAEVVVIESALPDHGRDALRALAAGCHVHVEKPPAHTLATMRRIVKLAREKRRRLQVGYQWRYHPGFLWMEEAVRRGWLGEIFQVRGSIHTQLATGRRAEWSMFAGGALFEQGSHLIDPLIRMLGRPRAVTPFLQTHGRTGDELRDNNVAVFRFDRALGVISNSTWQPNAGNHRTFEILGSNGSAVLRPIEPPTLQVDLARPAGSLRAGSQLVALPPFERYVGDFVELAAALREGKPLRVSPDQELLVHEWLLRACRMA